MQVRLSRFKFATKSCTMGLAGQIIYQRRENVTRSPAGNKAFSAPRRSRPICAVGGKRLRDLRVPSAANAHATFPTVLEIPSSTASSPPLWQSRNSFRRQSRVELAFFAGIRPCALPKRGRTGIFYPFSKKRERTSRSARPIAAKGWRNARTRLRRLPSSSRWPAAPLPSSPKLGNRIGSEEQLAKLRSSLFAMSRFLAALQAKRTPHVVGKMGEKPLRGDNGSIGSCDAIAHRFHVVASAGVTFDLVGRTMMLAAVILDNESFLRPKQIGIELPLGNDAALSGVGRDGVVGQWLRKPVSSQFARHSSK